MKMFVKILGFVGLYLLWKKRGNDKDNQYFPVQSDSERVAGHPIVGVS